MRNGVSINRWALAALLAGLVLASPAAYGAGFSIFEQGTKAMGMAGAFTAQADDPSALFHNAGGLAFQHEQDFALGFTYIRSLDATVEGADPFPGAGYTADQETLSEFPPHAYWVQPLNATWTFGLGVNAPFGLTTEWGDDFRGRFISRLASLTAIDVNPSLGWQVTPNFGLGFGAIGRFSTVELERNVAQFNPFTQTSADIATVHLEGDIADNSGYGWNVGLLHKVNNSFSWGLSYRSAIDIDYEGDTELTQNLTGTPFDALIAQALPFGATFPVETAIDFPDLISLGIAMAITPNSLVELDVNRTGWSSFEELQIVFPEGQLPNSTIPERYDDSYHYRLGLRYDSSPGRQWRFGVVFDETPQPEEAVSPLLPDSDRTGFTLGYGYEGAKYSFDLAAMYLLFDERTRDTNFPGEQASTFFGTYEQEALLLGLTLGF
jgi:long-chain fatty acid transport protein